MKIIDSAIIENLEAMDKTNPELRASNAYDDWFHRCAKNFHTSGKALEIVNKYGYLTRSYIEALPLTSPATKEFHREVQLKLIEPKNINDPFWGLKYYGLFWAYLKKYPLDSEVISLLYQDKRYTPALELHKRLNGLW